MLYEGDAKSALSSTWAPALDGRLTHALGCVILALRQQGGLPSSTELACEPTLRWQVADASMQSASPKGRKRPQNSSQSKEKDMGDKDESSQEAELVVTIVASSGENHTHVYTLPRVAANSKYTSKSGVGANLIQSYAHMQLLTPTLISRYLTILVCRW